MKHLIYASRSASLALCGLLLSSVGLSQTLPDSVPSMDVVRSRLNLTPEQEAQLAPLFKQRVSALQETRVRLESASTRNAKQDALRQAKADAKEFNTQVESLLKSDQKDEWREMREQTREKVKERYKRNRESQ